jgi:hypothetical protein
VSTVYGYEYGYDLSWVTSSEMIARSLPSDSRRQRVDQGADLAHNLNPAKFLVQAACLIGPLSRKPGDHRNGHNDVGSQE